jgi:hypothetical protein
MSLLVRQGQSLGALLSEFWRLIMVRVPTVSISIRELDRLKCIQAVTDGDLKSGQAAERLGLTVRQIERLVIRYRAESPIGLISRHRNRPGNRGSQKPAVQIANNGTEGFIR